MYTVTESGEDIQLTGKSGHCYIGKIFSDKNSTTALSGTAIVCLTNSYFAEEKWHHRMNSIYNTKHVELALDHFKSRDDISHMILVPAGSLAFGQVDHVDDLIRQYLHG